jgi:transposase
LPPLTQEGATASGYSAALAQTHHALDEQVALMPKLVHWVEGEPGLQPIQWSTPLVPRTQAYGQLNIHKMKRVRELIAAAGATVIYLPTYTPELNPTELWWNDLERELSRQSIDVEPELPKAARRERRRVASLHVARERFRSPTASKSMIANSFGVSSMTNGEGGWPCGFRSSLSSLSCRQHRRRCRRRIRSW